MARRISWQAKVVAALLVTVVLLVPLDWLAGFLVYRTGDYREHRDDGANWNQRDPSGVRQRDERFHHGLRPSASGTDRWGPLAYPLVTNSLGLRDAAPRAVPAQPAGRRLVFVGDSFTEGVGVPYGETWVARVRDALAPRGVEVLDAGVISYSAKLAYYKIKSLLEDGARFDEVVYFIDPSDIPDDLLYSEFMPANKAADDTWSGRFEKTPHTPAPYEYSLIARTIRKARGHDPWKQTEFTDRATGESFRFNNVRAEWVRGPEPPWLPHALASAEFYVGKLAELCAARGIAFSIAVYPWSSDLAAGPGAPSRHRDFWLMFAEQHGLKCHDLFPAFLEPAADARAAILAAEFIPGDVHWNAAGHRRVADAWLGQYVPPAPGAAGN